MAILIGHERVISLLDRAVHEGRPAHAYLFTGREGIGKKQAAIRFACRLNCPDPDSDPDGTCPVCRRIVGGNHPDVTIEVPERGIIRIDRIRSLQSHFRYAPIEGRFKVTVIDDAHTMNAAAQNALLKTLEEPPAGRILILVTSKPYVLLPTVRSRCRRIRFAPLSAGEVTGILEKSRGMSAEEAEMSASVSGGSVSRALEMDEAGFPDLRNQVLSVLTDPGAVGITGLVEMSATLSSDKKRAADAVDIAATWVRDQIVGMVRGHDGPSNPNGDCQDRASSSAPSRFSARELMRVYDELLKASELIDADINVNRNLVFDVMLLRIARIMAGPTFGVTRHDR
ncbi:MAG: DNA polymerase III subunit delta' [Desulfomonilaceae bacterium]|nr:DNA polymerase III subunit delta' [Desulfomonilaceae bacterium]